MKKKLLKSALALTIAFVSATVLAIPCFALPYNTEITSNYNYDYWKYAVEAPVAYTTEKVYSMEDLGLSGLFQPVDLFSRNGKLYVVDQAGNRVLVYDEKVQLISSIKTLRDTDDYSIPALNMSYTNDKGEIIYDTEMTSADKYSLNAPEGIYVTDEDVLYIADTENRRVVVCDMYGNVSNIYQHLKVSFISNFVFKPQKITVDGLGAMQVIAKNVNRGMLEIDSDGVFQTFIGTPKVTVSASDWFWRSIASEEQKKNFVKYVPTQYSNITTDKRGFIYSTISTIDYSQLKTAAGGGSVSGSTAPVAKLTPDGSDIMRRLGEFPPMGDVIFTESGSPKIVDCAVDNESGLYTILDQASGRFFTYDQDGRLFFIGGGSSNGQYGRFRTPTSIVCDGDYIYVSDSGNKTITSFCMTDYAKLVRSALAADSIGEFESASKLWTEVAAYNSNLYVAYIGIGKAEMRYAAKQTDKETMLGHYEKAMYYFSLANEKTNYSKAFTALRTEKLTQYFTLIVIVVLVIIAGIIVLSVINKRKSKKKGAGAE